MTRDTGETERERTCLLSRKTMDEEGHRREREGYQREGIG